MERIVLKTLKQQLQGLFKRTHWIRCYEDLHDDLIKQIIQLENADRKEWLEQKVQPIDNKYEYDLEMRNVINGWNACIKELLEKLNENNRGV